MGNLRIGYIESDASAEQICSRCRMCELICAFEHHGVGNPRRSGIRVVELGRGVDIPVSCLNCEDPPCRNICPTGAIQRREPDRIPTVDKNLCIGCSMCVNACPVGAVTIDPVEKTASKCDLCGGNPQCVKYCPAGVLKIVGADEIPRLARMRYARFISGAAIDHDQQAIGQGK